MARPAVRPRLGRGKAHAVSAVPVRPGKSAGTDPLTAYLATSPGGADSVAITAASSNVDVPFVMAMQMTRFILVMLIGPTLVRTVARWTEGQVPS